MKKLIITEDEKSRILEMHQNATSRQYLMEDTDSNTFFLYLPYTINANGNKEVAYQQFSNSSYLPSFSITVTDSNLVKSGKLSVKTITASDSKGNNITFSGKPGQKLEKDAKGTYRLSCQLFASVIWTTNQKQQFKGINWGQQPQLTNVVVSFSDNTTKTLSAIVNPGVEYKPSTPTQPK